jgi:hypothetical protein
MLKYALYPNHLTEGENDYSAIPQSLTSKKIEDIIQQITIPGSILKETECVAVIHDFFKAVSANLSEGYGFVSEYIRIHPKISGVFDGAEDQFDEQRHEKQISVVATSVLKDAVNDLKLEKVEANVRKPQIKSVYDLKSQETNGLLSPGHMLEIHGISLKLDNEQSDEGVFLINSADNSETKLEQIHMNLPSTLSGMLPDSLVSGSFLLEVRNRLIGNKSLTIGIYSKPLSVN